MYVRKPKETIEQSKDHKISIYPLNYVTANMKLSKQL